MVLTFLVIQAECSGSTNDLLRANPPSLVESLFGNVWSWRYLGSTYAKYIVKPPVKFTAIVLMTGVLAGSLWGLSRVGDGLNLTDVVPRGTIEHTFLDAQAKYFGFYNMHAVTQKDFEYPMNQRLLYEYHEAFMRVQNVIKNDDGGLPEFWLGLFRDWLIGEFVIVLIKLECRK